MNKKVIFGLIIFLVGFAVRVSLVSTARFTGDEISFYETAHNIVNGVEAPLLGTPLTAGKARHPGPTFYYLMALPLFIADYPELSNALVALLGAITVLIFFFGINRLVKTEYAFLGSLLMACSPWSILYADRIWNSNVIGLFVMISFYLTVRLRESYSRNHLILLFATCAIMPQFHMSVPIVWVAILYLLRKHILKISIKDYALAFSAAIFVNIPFLYHELTTDFLNTKNFLGESNKSNKSSKAFFQVITNMMQFLTLETAYHELSGYWKSYSERTYFSTWYMPTPARDFSIIHTFFRIAGIGFAVSAVVTLLSQFKSWGLKEVLKKDWVIAFLLGSTVSMLLLFMTGKKIYPHYVHPLFPFLFVIFPWALQKWGNKLKPRTIYIAVAIFCIGGIEASVMVSRGLDAKNGLGVQREVVEKVLSKVPESEKNINVEFNFYAFPEGYEVLSKTQYGRELLINKSNSGFTFFVSDKDTAPPSGRNWEKIALETKKVFLFLAR